MEQVRRVRRVGEQEADDEKNRERPQVSHGKTVSGDPAVRGLCRDAGEEGVIEHEPPFETDVGDDEKSESGDDHPFPDEKEEGRRPDARQREQEEESLPVARIIGDSTERRGESGSTDHGERDGRPPEPALASGHVVGEIAGIDDGDNDDGEGGLCEIEKGPGEYAPAGNARPGGDRRTGVLIPWSGDREWGRKITHAEFRLPVFPLPA